MLHHRHNINSNIDRVVDMLAENISQDHTQTEEYIQDMMQSWERHNKIRGGDSKDQQAVNINNNTSSHNINKSSSTGTSNSLDRKLQQPIVIKELIITNSPAEWGKHTWKEVWHRHSCRILGSSESPPWCPCYFFRRSFFEQESLRDRSLEDPRTCFHCLDSRYHGLLFPSKMSYSGKTSMHHSWGCCCCWHGWYCGW